MSKKNFEGEGKPSSVIVKSITPTGATATISEAGPVVVGVVVHAQGTITAVAHHTILTDAEKATLRVLLDRDRTSKQVHGGLRSILNLSESEAETLLNFLRRI